MTRLTLALLFVPTIAAAQLPRVWVDASAGFAESDLSRYIGGTQIVGQVLLGAAVRGAYGIELGMWETPGIFGGYKVTSICILPTGGTRCFVQNALNASGLTASAVWAWISDVPGAVSLGAGDYVLSAPDNYSSSTRAFGIQGAITGEAAASHAALTVSVRPIVFPNLHGRREWMIPVEAGFRFW